MNDAERASELTHGRLKTELPPLRRCRGGPTNHRHSPLRAEPPSPDPGRAARLGLQHSTRALAILLQVGVRLCSTSLGQVPPVPRRGNKAALRAWTSRGFTYSTPPPWPHPVKSQAVHSLGPRGVLAGDMWARAPIGTVISGRLQFGEEPAISPQERRVVLLGSRELLPLVEQTGSSAAQCQAAAERSARAPWPAAQLIGVLPIHPKRVCVQFPVRAHT